MKLEKSKVRNYELNDIFSKTKPYSSKKMQSNKDLVKVKRSRTLEITEEIHSNLQKFQDEYYLERSNPLNWNRIKKMFYIILMMLVEHFIRGSVFLPSFIGIGRYVIKFFCIKLLLSTFS